MDTHGERSSTHSNTFADPFPRGREILRVGIGLYLLLMGGLVGLLVERVRFDQRREAVIARYDVVLGERNGRLIAIERAIAERRLESEDHDLAAN